jgi:hypothetical protein
MWDGSTMHLILNGQLIPLSLTGGTDSRAVANPRIFIGYDSYGNAYTEECEIALVLVYNRVLLAEEIKRLYEHPDMPIWTGLVLWLDQTTINPPVWTDRSPYGNDGTIYGAVKQAVLKESARVNPGLRLQPAVR